jgi:putative transposase
MRRSSCEVGEIVVADAVESAALAPTKMDVRDLMVAALEQRFGQVNRLPAPIEGLSDNGSCYTATETRKFAKDIGFLPLTTPVESPQSNGMAEA